MLEALELLDVVENQRNARCHFMYNFVLGIKLILFFNSLEVLFFLFRTTSLHRLKVIGLVFISSLSDQSNMTVVF